MDPKVNTNPRKLEMDPKVNTLLAYCSQIPFFLFAC